jgi:predicted transcriptional regulator of viral defense system
MRYYFFKVLMPAFLRNIMKFLEFKSLFKNFTVFSLADIRMADGAFHRRRLSEWQERGYIRMLIRGYYCFSDLNLSEEVLCEIANRTYDPSYVSFESAMALYGLIPGTALGIFSAATRKTSRFTTSVGCFLYRALKPSAFFGYTVVPYGHGTYKIAEIEKAIVDYLYLHADDDGISALRVDPDVFRSRVNQEKLRSFAGRIGKKALIRRVARFMEYMEHA